MVWLHLGRQRKVICYNLVTRNPQNYVKIVLQPSKRGMLNKGTQKVVFSDRLNASPRPAPWGRGLVQCALRIELNRPTSSKVKVSAQFGWARSRIVRVSQGSHIHKDSRTGRLVTYRKAFVWNMSLCATSLG